MRIPEPKEVISFIKINVATIAATGVAMILFILLFNLFTLPKLKKFISLSKEVSVLVGSKDAIEAAKNHKLLFEKELKELEQKYYKNENILIADSQDESFLNDLAELAKAANVKLVSIQPLAKIQKSIPSSNEIYFELPYKIQIGCGYHELGSFLNQLENKKGRSLRMNRLEITSIGTDIWEHNIYLEFSVFAKNF